MSAMTGYVRGAAWALLSLAGAGVVALAWAGDPRLWIEDRCLVSQHLQAADAAAPEPDRACHELAGSILPAWQWHGTIAGGVAVGALAGVLLVLLVFTPSVNLPGATSARAQTERERIRTAAGGTAKAAAGFGAAVVAAGLKPDTLAPPVFVVGAVLGVATLLLLAAEATHATRA